MTKYKVLDAAGEARRDIVSRRASPSASRTPSIRRASRSRPAPAAATAAAAATSAPRTRWRSPICPTRCVTAREHVHGAQGRHVQQGRQTAMAGHRPRVIGPERGASPNVAIEAPVVVLAAGTLGSTEILLRSREHGARRFRPARAALLGQRRHHRLRLRRQIAGQRGRRRAIPPKVEGLEVGAVVSGQLEYPRRRRRSPTSSTCRKARCRRHSHPCCRCCSCRTGACSARCRASSTASTKGRSPACRRSSPCRTTARRDASRSRTTSSRCRGPNAKDEPVYARLDAILSKRSWQASGGDYVKNPLAGTVMGHQPATAHPLGGCGMGRDRSDGVVDHKCRVFDGGTDAGDTRRARRALRHRRRGDSAFARRQSAADDHGAFRTRDAALCAGPRPAATQRHPSDAVAAA